MNLYKQEMYKKSLQHGVPWRKHKYIRKEGDRYIYPEDLAKGNKSNTTTWDNANIQTWDNSVKPINVKPITVTSGPSKSDLIKQLNKKNAKKRAQNAAIANGQNYSKQMESQKRDQDANRKGSRIEDKLNTAEYAIDRRWNSRKLNHDDRIIEARQDTANRKKEEAKAKADEKINAKRKEYSQIKSAHQGATSRANMQQYDKNDKDFSDENYNKSKRIGNTEFSSFKRPDGKYIILEEDMKWVVNTPPDANMQKRLNSFTKYVNDMRKAGYKVDSDQWEQWATQAINGVDFSKRKIQRKK